MMDVVVDPDAFTKLPPAILEQIKQKLLDKEIDTHKAKTTWEDALRLKNGNRYAVSCKREGGKVVIIGARLTKNQ